MSDLNHLLRLVTEVSVDDAPLPDGAHCTDPGTDPAGDSHANAQTESPSGGGASEPEPGGDPPPAMSAEDALAALQAAIACA